MDAVRRLACRQTRSLLHRVADRRGAYGTPPRRARRHLEHCAPCAALWMRLDALRAALERRRVRGLADPTSVERLVALAADLDRRAAR